MPLKNVIAFSRSETHHYSFRKAYAEVIAGLIFINKRQIIMPGVFPAFFNRSEFNGPTRKI